LHFKFRIRFHCEFRVGFNCKTASDIIAISSKTIQTHGRGFLLGSNPNGEKESRRTRAEMIKQPRVCV
jgi:hypothetical protein